MTAVLFALGVTLVVEPPIVAVFYPGERLRMGIVAIAVNTVTNLSMNTLLFRFASSYSSYLLIGEIGTVFVEAAVYCLVSRERDVGKALAASAIANAASFAAGLVAMPVASVIGVSSNRLRSIFSFLKAGNDSGNLA